MERVRSGERHYPTDAIGIPVPPEELGYDLDAGGERNNHHMAFFARTFGRFAISSAFRNLESMQVEMPKTEHTKLHQDYTGIEMPHFITMLDAIHDEWYQGRGLKIYHPNLPSGERYQHHEITDALWRELMIEYKEVKY